MPTFYKTLKLPFLNKLGSLICSFKEKSFIHLLDGSMLKTLSCRGGHLGYWIDNRKVDDIKEVFRSRKSNLDRQYNEQKKKTNIDRQNTTQKTTD